MRTEDLGSQERGWAQDSFTHFLLCWFIQDVSWALVNTRYRLDNGCTLVSSWWPAKRQILCLYTCASPKRLPFLLNNLFILAALDLHWVSWDLSLQHIDSLVVAHGLSSCSAQTSAAVAHRPSCSMACGILVPWPGVEPMSLAFQGAFFTLSYQLSPKAISEKAQDQEVRGLANCGRKGSTTNQKFW